MAASPPGPILQVASRSHTGWVRARNEDALHVDAARRMLLLADGLGGCNAGDLASRIAVERVAATLAAAFDETEPGRQLASGKLAVHVALRDAFAAGNAAILGAATTPQTEGMGSTLVGMVFYGNRVAIAHVGDSRAYRLRAGTLERLTRDHTLLQEQVDQGVLDAQAAQPYRSGTLLTRALGAAVGAEADLIDTDAADDDVYLLCSDGLTDQVDDATLLAVLSDVSPGMDALAGRLVQCALDGGGLDNVSVILARVSAHPHGRGLRGSLAMLLG